MGDGRCETCRWSDEVPGDDAFGLYLCKRFPRWEEVPFDHQCGEYTAAEGVE